MIELKLQRYNGKRTFDRAWAGINNAQKTPSFCSKALIRRLPNGSVPEDNDSRVTGNKRLCLFPAICSVLHAVYSQEERK